MAVAVLILLGVGIFMRISLFGTSFADWFAERNEVTTPLTSWNRVVEGLSLYKAGVSPYSGDIFHQMPLILRLLNFLNSSLGPSVYIVFLAVDVFIALLLESVGRRHCQLMLREQGYNVKSYSPDALQLILRGSDLVYTRVYVVAAYMLNPYTIITCVTKSTAVFDNLFIALVLFFLVRANRNKSCFFVAVAAYLSLYPIMLVVPVAVHIAREQVGRENLLKSDGISSMLTTGAITVLMWMGLLYASYLVQGSWAFLGSTYGFILSVPDLTPNMGVFWYFFTEMFEHFRTFFICVFQINAFIYTLPLAIRLRHHPMFLMHLLIALMAIFKSYPCYGDTVIYLSLLPLWRHTFQFMRNNFLVACMLVATSVLAPILYHLWIYSGSANANFYFAISLAYSTGQILLISDLLFGYLKRECALELGPEPKLESGEPADVVLE